MDKANSFYLFAVQHDGLSKQKRRLRVKKTQNFIENLLLTRGAQTPVRLKYSTVSLQFQFVFGIGAGPNHVGTMLDTSCSCAMLD